jgi:hypothetical protein
MGCIVPPYTLDCNDDSALAYCIIAGGKNTDATVEWGGDGAMDGCVLLLPEGRTLWLLVAMAVAVEKGVGVDVGRVTGGSGGGCTATAAAAATAAAVVAVVTAPVDRADDDDDDDPLTVADGVVVVGVVEAGADADPLGWLADAGVAVAVDPPLLLSLAPPP